MIDADRISSDLMAPRGKCFKAITKEFGTEIIQGGEIDRRKLAGIVFAQPQKLKKLNAIVHPMVRKEIERQLAGLRKGKQTDLVVLDVPLLIEAAWHRDVDAVVVVKTNRPTQINRIRRRTSLSQADIIRRIRQQMPMRDKLKYADFTIDNSGTLSQTRGQVRQVLQNITKN